MDFHELVAHLQNPGEGVDVDPSMFNELTSSYDGLQSSYDELKSGSTARMSELTANVSERDAKIADLKARNYDLLMASQADPPPPPANESVRKGIAGLFKNGNK